METGTPWSEAVARLLRDRDGCAAMVLIAGPTGLEILTNHEDIVVKLGILRAANVITESVFKAMIEQWQTNGMSQAVTADLERTMAGKDRFDN